MESLLRDLTGPSRRIYSDADLARTIEVLADALGRNVAAQAEGSRLNRDQLDASRRLILIGRRIAYAARHPGEAA